VRRFLRRAHRVKTTGDDQHPRVRPSRRGVAAVEFAIISPVLVLLILGMIEFGRMMMMQQILTNASREGARRAIVETTTNGEVVSVVNDYLASTGIAGATVTVSPTDLGAIALGDPVTVRVTTPYSANSWLPSPWFLGGTTVQAESVMRAERLQ